MKGEISYNDHITQERMGNRRPSPIFMNIGEYHECVNNMFKLLHLTGFALNPYNLNEILYSDELKSGSFMYALTYTGEIHTYSNINDSPRPNDAYIITDIDEYETDDDFIIPYKNDYFLLIIVILGLVITSLIFMLSSYTALLMIHILTIVFVSVQMGDSFKIKDRPFLTYLGIKGTYDDDVIRINGKLNQSIYRVEQVFNIVADMDFYSHSICMSTWNNKKRIIRELYDSENISYDLP